MIQPDRKNGREMAKCTCDVCGAEASLPAMHGNAAPGTRGLKQVKLPPLVNEASVIKRLQSDRWSLISNKLRCPACEAARKTPKEPAMPENVSEIRQPTREQKREISQMLESVYDTKAGMYQGSETDQTVAAAMGGGIMPGWVAAIRDEFFGPSGENGDMAALKFTLEQHIKKWEASEKVLAELIEKYQVDVDATKKQLARLEAIKAAVGPKAARA